MTDAPDAAARKAADARTARRRADRVGGPGKRPHDHAHHKSSAGGRRDPQPPPAPPEEVVDRLACLLPAEELQDALKGLAPKQMADRQGAQSGALRRVDALDAHAKTYDAPRLATSAPLRGLRDALPLGRGHGRRA